MVMNRVFSLSAFALLSVLVGCGTPMDADIAEAEEAVTLNQYTAGPFGPMNGTIQQATSNKLTPITKFAVWADGTFIYAIKVWWGTTSALYGDNSNGTRTVATLAANQWVSDIWVCIDARGYLRGLSFDANNGLGLMTVGYISDGFNKGFTNGKWTDLTSSSLILGGGSKLTGLQLNYLAP